MLLCQIPRIKYSKLTEYGICPKSAFDFNIINKFSLLYHHDATNFRIHLELNRFFFVLLKGVYHKLARLKHIDKIAHQLWASHHPLKQSFTSVVVVASHFITIHNFINTIKSRILFRINWTGLFIELLKWTIINLPSNPVETSNKFPRMGNGVGPGTFPMRRSIRRRRSLHDTKYVVNKTNNTVVTGEKYVNIERARCKITLFIFINCLISLFFRFVCLSVCLSFQLCELRVFEPFNSLFFLLLLSSQIITIKKTGYIKCILLYRMNKTSKIIEHKLR